MHRWLMMEIQEIGYLWYKTLKAKYFLYGVEEIVKLFNLSARNFFVNHSCIACLMSGSLLCITESQLYTKLNFMQIEIDSLKGQ